MTELSLNVSRTIKASAEALFEAWLDPKMLAKFMLPGEGVSIAKASTDPVVGGRFDIVMQAGDKEIPHNGIYKNIDRYSKLVFTWQSPFSVDDSTVTLTFTPVDDGTEVNLHHVRFASEESRDNHQDGWSRILAALDTQKS